MRKSCHRQAKSSSRFKISQWYSKLYFLLWIMIVNDSCVKLQMRCVNFATDGQTTAFKVVFKIQNQSLVLQIVFSTMDYHCE